MAEYDIIIMGSVEASYPLSLDLPRLTDSIRQNPIPGPDFLDGQPLESDISTTRANGGKKSNYMV